MDIDDFIKSATDDVSDLGEQLVNIDVEGIDREAKSDAHQMVDNLSKFYYDEAFMSKHPQIKKRIEDELESMRILIKMRKADEEAHDALIKAISANNTNASLYKALTQIQGTILSVTTKMGEIVDRLNHMMKGYQLELPYEQQDQTDNNTEITAKNTYRGTKEFIKNMLSQEQSSLILEQEDPPVLPSRHIDC